MNETLDAFLHAFGASMQSLRGREIQPPKAVEVARMTRDIECGLHSGFPPCCIAFFVVVKRHMDPGSAEWHAYDRKLKEACKAAGRYQWRRLRDGRRVRVPSVEYAPCPSCIERHSFVRVKPCPRGSHKDRRR